ncbi:MAG: putative lipid II flippase FtsW [Candidatus Nealsonbacteria bacterium]
MLKSTVKAIKDLDHILIFVTGLLIIFGIAVLASASTSVPQQKDTIYYLLNHQILAGLIPGVLLAFLLSTKISLRFLKKKAPLFLLISLVLMVMVFLPGIGKKSGTASRWISLKYISFQPSEILKLSFILYLASWLENRNKKASSSHFKENLITFLLILGVITLLLYLQSDIGTLGVILATAGLMYFFAETPIWHIVLIGIIGIFGFFIFIKLTPYRLDRILVFLNPETDPMGIGYQIEQSLIAVGSGKIFGLALGMSQQKFGLLPHPISDSIFAILAEETGFVGSSILIFLFLLFLWRGYKIGKESKNMFSKLTTLGITSWILIQTFVNIGSMLGILPLIGIPLPFISYGGSALIVELAGVGILLNISRQN